MKVLGFLVFILFLTSCATLNKEQCERTNWKTLGEKDGQKGHSSSRLGSHQKACSEHGINVDIPAYTSGYQDGLKLFCTLENGFEQGKAGRRNSRVCPPKLQVLFTKGYMQGQKIYKIKKKIILAEKNIEKIENEIDATYTQEKIDHKSYASKRTSLDRKRRSEERKLRKFERALNLITTTALIKKLL